ncbi:hypothetical protein EYF80_011604 [Liparis tanakae]|uniref:Uncharacterized protein n=1 Tax=Liparis tanakae TaxID=230148 RepID=A0A4Z2IJE0_9TELE|nr:hypothetical protein EYF80_011604 [Liparis tanakae]
MCWLAQVTSTGLQSCSEGHTLQTEVRFHFICSNDIQNQSGSPHSQTEEIHIIKGLEKRPWTHSVINLLLTTEDGSLPTKAHFHSIDRHHALYSTPSRNDCIEV